MAYQIKTIIHESGKPDVEKYSDKIFTNLEDARAALRSFADVPDDSGLNQFCEFYARGTILKRRYVGDDVTSFTHIIKPIY